MYGVSIWLINYQSYKIDGIMFCDAKINIIMWKTRKQTKCIYFNILKKNLGYHIPIEDKHITNAIKL